MAINELILEFSLPGLNEIIAASKRHWAVYANMKKKYMQMVETELMAQDCIPDKPFMQIDIEFIWTEKGRGRDPDGVRTGAKFVCDAMVNQGIMPDDSMKYVWSIRDTFRKGKERGVIVKWTAHKEE